jgi:type IV secretory pathway TrbL component
MQNSSFQNNPVIFWLGLVLFFVGIVAAWLYLIGPHVAIFGPGIRVKHGLAAIGVAVVGAVIASFARPRGATLSETNRYNR